MKLVKGDILEFNSEKNYSAEKGARAIYKGYTFGHDGEQYIQVEWIRDGKDKNQEDGGYFESQFTKVEDASTQKEVRILKEKSMEFNFVEGKERVVKMLESHIENFKTDMLNDIKITITEAPGSLDALGEVESILESIKYNTEACGKAITRVKIATSVQEVLRAVDHTAYAEMEETVLCALFGLDSLTID